MKYFIKPLLIDAGSEGFSADYKTFSEYSGKKYISIDPSYISYTDYNYLRPGIMQYIKTQHFETALNLTKEYFNKCNVIDFGCADGPFLPSLSKYFQKVLALDIEPGYINIALRLKKQMALNNVEIILNDKLTIKDVKALISGNKYKIVYFLEGLEHIGDKEGFYESKKEFLRQISTLIEDDGIIVLSVPNMVGIAFLMQRIGYKCFGIDAEPLSLSNLLKAVFLRNTNDLEKEWAGKHLGFNHLKLEKELKKDFSIIKRNNILFHMLYVIKKKQNIKSRK